jgi:outer membrane receptor protein involved in Fe transport
MAQQAADADADSNVIVVTAQKREQNLQDVPVAITAIGTEKLDQLQVKEFSDVVNSCRRSRSNRAAPALLKSISAA